MNTAAVLGQILLLCSLGMAGLVISRYTRLPATLACVLCGAAFGQALPLLGLDTGIRAGNYGDVLFYLLLPILIFEAAWHIEPELLLQRLPAIISLTVVGMAVFTLVCALLLFFGFGHPLGFPLLAAVLASTILAATDPSAVITQLQRTGASRELLVVIEGESLFNDAAAVVAFAAVLSFALGEQSGAGGALQSIGIFFTKLMGGLLIGGALGWLCNRLLRSLTAIDNQGFILALLAYASFYVAEGLLHVSGVIAVMACALIARKGFGQAAAVNSISWLATLCTTVLFVMLGLVFEYQMLSERWLAMTIGIVAALLARALAVWSSLALVRLSRQPCPSVKESPIMIIGGLRGAVTIALALSIPTDLPWWWTVQSIAFGVVVFNLFAQGPALALLVKLLYRQDEPSRP